MDNIVQQAKDKLSLRFNVGDKVTYNKEHGIIKTIKDGNIFVVYNCGGDWGNYENYTAANTSKNKLVRGWV